MFSSFTRHGPTFVCVVGMEAENDVSFVINCYDVEQSSPDFCKCNIIEWQYLEEFFRI